MRKIVVALCVLMGAGCLPAASQDKPKDPLYRLDLPMAQINVIGAALMKQPYEIVAPILESLHDQIEADKAAMQQPKATSPAPGLPPVVNLPGAGGGN